MTARHTIVLIGVQLTQGSDLWPQLFYGMCITLQHLSLLKQSVSSCEDNSWLADKKRNFQELSLYTKEAEWNNSGRWEPVHKTQGTYYKQNDRTKLYGCTVNSVEERQHKKFTTVKSDFAGDKSQMISHEHLLRVMGVISVEAN